MVSWGSLVLRVREKRHLSAAVLARHLSSRQVLSCYRGCCINHVGFEQEFKDTRCCVIVESSEAVIAVRLCKLSIHTSISQPIHGIFKQSHVLEPSPASVNKFNHDS